MDKCVAGRKCVLSDVEFDLRKDAEREQFFHESRGGYSLKWKSLAYCGLSEEGFDRNPYQEKCSVWCACFEQCICSFEPFSDFFQIEQGLSCRGDFVARGSMMTRENLHPGCS